MPTHHLPWYFPSPLSTHLLLRTTMDCSTTDVLIRSADNNNEWNQQLFIIHNDKWLDISCAAMGKSSTTPLGAPDQPAKYPYGSVYRLDTKFKGIEKCEEVIRLLRLLDVHPGCAVTIRNTDQRYSSTRLGTWSLYCSQYRTPPHNTNNKVFDEGNFAQSKVKAPTTKHTNTAGTTNKNVVGMFNKTNRQHVASLNDQPSQCLNHDHQLDNDDATQIKQRCTHSKFVDGSCAMKITVFLNTKDEYYYLSTSSTLVHTYHAKLPLKAIPQNGAMLSEKELELLNNLFQCRLPRSQVANVLETVVGKESTHIDPMTVYNLRNKSLNLINKKSGYTGDLTDPSKTLKKLKEWVRSVQ